MEETNIEQDIRDREEFFEFYNYWTRMSEMGFQLFSISFVESAFFYVNALQIVILNFEFRFYLKKK